MALVDSIFALIAFAFLIYAIVEGVRAFKPGSSSQTNAPGSNPGIPLGPTEPGVTYIPPTNPDQGKMAIKKTLIFLKTFKKLKKDTDKEKYLQKYADTLLALLVQCKSFCLSVSNQKVLYNWNAFYRLWHDQSYQGEQLSISKFSANVPQLIEHLSNIQEEVKRMS